MFRLVFLVFFGEPRFDTARHPSARVAAVDGDAAGAAGDPVGGDRLVDRLAAGRGLDPRLPGAGLPRCRRHAPRGDEVASLYMLQEEAVPAGEGEGEEGTAQRGDRRAPRLAARRSSPSAIASTVAAVAGIGLAYLTYSRRTDAGSGSARFCPLPLPARQMALGRALQRRHRPAAERSRQCALAGGRHRASSTARSTASASASAPSASACATSRPVSWRTTRWRSRSAWSCWSAIYLGLSSTLFR